MSLSSLCFGHFVIQMHAWTRHLGKSFLWLLTVCLVVQSGLVLQSTVANLTVGSHGKNLDVLVNKINILTKVWQEIKCDFGILAHILSNIESILIK